MLERGLQGYRAEECPGFHARAGEVGDELVALEREFVLDNDAIHPVHIERPVALDGKSQTWYPCQQAVIGVCDATLLLQRLVDLPQLGKAHGCMHTGHSFSESELSSEVP